MHHVKSVDTDYLRIWRVSLMGRAATVGFTILWMALAGMVSVGSHATGTPLLLWFSAATLALASWRMAWVPYVALGRTAVTVQNPVRRAVVPYHEIVDVRGGYYGLTLRTRSRMAVTAWAVQKSNASRWGHKKTRADTVAAAILAQQDAATHAHE